MSKDEGRQVVTTYESGKEYCLSTSCWPPEESVWMFEATNDPISLIISRLGRKAIEHVNDVVFIWNPLFPQVFGFCLVAFTPNRTFDPLEEPCGERLRALPKKIDSVVPSRPRPGIGEFVGSCPVNGTDDF